MIDEISFNEVVKKAVCP